MLGDSGVGKTSIVTRWTKDTFKQGTSATIGAAFVETTVEKNGQHHVIQIWDTAGEEKYKSMAPIYARSAVAALIVFDITHESSFLNVEEWISCLDLLNDVKVIIIGNKCDMEAQREVSYDKALALASKLGRQYVETSAFAGTGVKEAFQMIIDQILENRTSLDVKTQRVGLATPPPEPSKDCC